MNPRYALASVLLVSSCCLLFSAPMPAMEDRVTSKWQEHDLSFRPINIASNGPSLWVCGTEEGIAASEDNGVHWSVKHQASGGGVLLLIAFANDKFGYAAGTSGLLLTTEDGGDTWVERPTASGTILQAALADARHGLIRTAESLLFTDDGAHWEDVSSRVNSDDLKRFRFPFSLVAVDAAHMGVMLKQGSAQYEPQEFLFTQNSGKTWAFLNIPNVTLYSFLRVRDQYWVVGTEVVHKDQPGGGYAVPVALHSSDGENWIHSNNDLSACKLHMCTVCTSAGCFSSNGTITDVFSEKTSYRAFASDKDLTPKWAATDSSICFVASHLQCALTENLSERPGETASSGPSVVAPGPLGAPNPPTPRCIICGFNGLFVDAKKQGNFAIKLSLLIGTDGTVASAEAQDAPTAEIKDGIEQQARQWVFEPYRKDGKVVNVRLNTTIRVTLIRSR